MRFFRFDDPVHQEVTELLPWFANGTLAGIERARVERHVSECIACRGELENLRALQYAIANEDFDSGSTRAFAQLKARIEQGQARGTRDRFHALAARWHLSGVWARSLLIAQFAALVLIAMLYLYRPAPEYYHTLAAPTLAPRGDLVVVFQATTSEREIRDALLRVHARITDGPSAEGAYTLQVRDGEQQTALEQLRQLTIVRFCEPVVQPTGTS
jgi:hypothetical protein